MVDFTLDVKRNVTGLSFAATFAQIIVPNALPARGNVITGVCTVDVLKLVENCASSVLKNAPGRAGITPVQKDVLNHVIVPGVTGLVACS